jgi:hypothetical protein
VGEHKKEVAAMEVDVGQALGAQERRLRAMWRADKKAVKEALQLKYQQLQQRYGELELEKAEAVVARRAAVQEAAGRAAEQAAMNLELAIQDCQAAHSAEQQQLRAARKEEKEQLLQRVQRLQQRLSEVEYEKAAAVLQVREMIRQQLHTERHTTKKAP